MRATDMPCVTASIKNWRFAESGMKNLAKYAVAGGLAILVSFVFMILCLPESSDDNTTVGISNPAVRTPRNFLPIDSKKWSRKYDGLFKKYNKRFFGFLLDWRWFKAQGAAESSLRDDPRVVSRAGARGIMQIMDDTYEMIRKKNGWIVGPVTEARWNIAAGIWYDRYLWDYWKARRPVADRICFMFWSYNCGPGCILQSQKKCVASEENADSCNLMNAMEPFVPKEPRNYVKKIRKMMGIGGR